MVRSATSAAAGVSYAFSLFPSLQGLISANILAGVATDAAGNVNTAAPTFSRTYDSATPAVSMSSTSSNSTNLSPIQVVVTFSKPVADFIITDITPTNATVANFSGAGVSYTFNLLPILQGRSAPISPQMWLMMPPATVTRLQPLLPGSMTPLRRSSLL